jgi:hypothetical protein
VLPQCQLVYIENRIICEVVPVARLSPPGTPSIPGAD